MNLLRDLPWLRLWRRLAVRRRPAQAFTVTVPAPLASAGVIELRRPLPEARPQALPRVANG
jgi:hypothetical protein